MREREKKNRYKVRWDETANIQQVNTIVKTKQGNSEWEREGTALKN
jgi:hypothetical protein